MKTLLILILGSLSLAAGGVVLLFMNGDNILSIDLWRLAFKAMITSPNTLMTEALGGSDAAFFRGIFIAVSGVLAALFFVGLAGLSLLGKSVFGVLKSSKKKSGSWNKNNPTDEGIALKNQSPVKGKKPLELGAKISGFFVSLKSKSGNKKDVFVDQEADLDHEGGEQKVGLLEKIRSKFARESSSRKTIVIKSGHKEEAVVEIEDTMDFLADLKSWYQGIKNASKEDPSCIAEAQSLSSRASRRSRAKVIEEDAMNGEFMLRMMDAWASKKPGTAKTDSAIEPLKVSPDGGDSSAFNRAIQDVMISGVATEDDDEDDDFPIEDVDDEDDDFIIQDIDEDGDLSNDPVEDDADDEFTIVDEDEDEADDTEILQDKSEEDVTDTDGDLKSIRAAAHIIDLEMRAASIANYEDEWDEDLTEPDARRALIEEMFAALEAAIETEGSRVMELSSFDAGDDQREVDWLQDNMETLADKKSSMLDDIAPMSSEDSDDDDEDLEAAFGIDTNTMDSDIAGEDTATDVNDFEDDPAPDEAQDDDDISSEDQSDVVEEVVEEVVTEASQIEPEAIQEVVVPAVEKPIEKESVLEPEVEVAPHVPKNISLGELEEIEKCDELIYKWGYVAKGAGAAEAKISHSVLVKDGLRRRVVGISHLVAQWRKHNSEDNRRLNILLRYVPEGEWTLTMDNCRENGIKMVDTNGDFVQVSAELLQQPEIENAIVLVHFYGPGAESGVLEEAGNVIVTTETLSVDVVKQKMDS